MIRYFLLISLLSSFLGSQAQDAEQYYQKGFAFEKSGKCKEAIKYYRKATTQNPRIQKAWLQMGHCQETLQQWDQAIISYTAVLKYDSTHVDARYFRAIAYYELKQPEMALADFSAVIDLDASRSQAFYYLGLINYEKGRYKNAISDLSNYLAVMPRSKDALQMRGEAYLKIKNWKMALEDGIQYQQVDPASAIGCWIQARAYFELQQWEQAQQQAIAAYERNKNLSSAALMAGDVSWKLSQQTTACKWWELVKEQETAAKKALLEHCP